MSVISYAGAPYEVRADLVDAHRTYWARLAAPGTWLTGAERVAVAAQVRQARHCELCARRKAALSPYAEAGEHDAAGDLPPAWVELVHRVVTDPARLSKSWFDGLVAQGVDHARYVEILGTLVEVLLIDEFCRGLGLAPHPLPEPQPGEPSRYTPANATLGEAWVPMIPRIIDEGPEADLWATRGGNVIRALSLVPDEVRHMLALLKVHYLDNDAIWNMAQSPQGTLTRPQTEVVATRVSSHNDCFY